MAQYLDEMQDYIRIAGKTVASTGEHDSPVLQESATADQMNPTAILCEELSDVVFKLRSYRELSEDQNYALGVEEGLELAAEMISRLLERHNSK